MARIAVIGAGMGAMAASARLAVAGHRVAVYERRETHGGGVRRLERDGFGFDTGPGLLHLPAVYRDLFVKTGKEPLERCVELSQVDPASRHVFADGSAVSLPNASRAGIVHALDSALGAGTGERWSELVNRARDVWEATRRPLLEEPLGPGSDALGRDPYPASGRGLFRRRAQAGPLAATARRELRDPRLAALLESHALAYGFDPRRVPASAAVLAYLEQTFGTWYAGGGMRALADALFRRCRDRGVEFHFGAGVADVAVDGGRVAGLVLSDGTLVDADIVVAGTNPRRLPGAQRPATAGAGRPRPEDGIPAPEGPPGHGRFTVLMALRGARPAGTPHRTVVHAPHREAELAALDGESGGAGARPTVVVLRPDDPAQRPDDNHEAVVLSVAAPAHRPSAGGPGGPGGAAEGAGGGPHGRKAAPVAYTGVDWSAGPVVDRWTEQILAAVDAAGLDLAERLLWHEVRTPADTARETGAPGGTVPGPALAGAGGAFLRTGNRAALPGLYLAGGWAHPGGGLAHAGMSGALVAGLIVEGDDWRGSY
jgi:phytoene desaturase